MQGKVQRQHREGGSVWGRAREEGGSQGGPGREHVREGQGGGRETGVAGRECRGEGQEREGARECHGGSA
jgi:hypothetical protein